MRWPSTTRLQPCITVTPYSAESVGSALNAPLTGAASAANPGADIVLYVPFTLFAPTMFDNAFWVNGATAAGNVDMGVYSTSGVKLASTGATAQTGTNTLQSAAMKAAFPAGQYFMAITFSDATATMFRTTLPQATAFALVGGAQEQGAGGLPATASWTTYNTTFFPACMGLSTRQVI